MKLIELIASRNVSPNEVEEIRRMFEVEGIPAAAPPKLIPGATAMIGYPALDVIVAAVAGGFLGAIGTDIWQKLKAGIFRTIAYLRGRPQFLDHLDPEVALIFGDGKETVIYVEIPNVGEDKLGQIWDTLAAYLKKSKAKQQWILYDKNRGQWETKKSLPPRGRPGAYSLTDVVKGWMSVSQASEWTGLSQGYLRYLLRIGRIDGLKSHGRWLVDHRSLPYRLKSK